MQIGVFYKHDFGWKKCQKSGKKVKKSGKRNSGKNIFRVFRKTPKTAKIRICKETGNTLEGKSGKKSKKCDFRGEKKVQILEKSGTEKVTKIRKKVEKSDKNDVFLDHFSVFFCILCGFYKTCFLKRRLIAPLGIEKSINR